jgi:2-methylcitrate dehydratase PrpD
MPPLSLTFSLADFCTSITPESIENNLVDQTGLLLLDHLGVTARGIQSPSAKALIQAQEYMGFPEGIQLLIATSRTTSATNSALLHGLAAHSLELDDLHNASSLHPGVVVFPSVFAAAQLARTRPMTLIAAVLTGYEVATRVGEAVNPASHYIKGFHPTATCGVFGAAAAVGKILELSSEDLAEAWGICGSMAAGSMAFLSGDAWTKHLHAGWAAKAGLKAAVMARHGFRAPKTILEDPLGFFHAYADSPYPDRLTAELGKRWAVMETSLKPHACCRYMQPAIDGLIALAEEHDLDPRGVSAVTVHCLPAGFPIIAEPHEKKADPQRTSEAQFSMPFGATVALVRRRAGLEEFGEEALGDPTVRALLPKVRCIKDEALGALWPKKWSAVVEVTTTDGRRLNRRVEDPKGDPTNPFTEAEIVDKFIGLTSSCYSTEHGNKLAEAALGVGRLKALDTFWRLLPSGSK